MPEVNDLTQDDKIYFSDESKNAKPTKQTLQSALDRYKSNVADKIKNDFEEWSFNHGKMIPLILESLMEMSKADIIKQIIDEARRFGWLASYIHKSVRNVPSRSTLLFPLISRTVLYPIHHSEEWIEPESALRKCSWYTAHFRTKSGKTMEINVQMVEISVKNIRDIIIDFSLPDEYNVKLHLHREEFKQRFVELAPLTQALQECIDADYLNLFNSLKFRPKIRNAFTIVYFISLLCINNSFQNDIMQYNKPFKGAKSHNPKRGKSYYWKLKFR